LVVIRNVAQSAADHRSAVTDGQKGHSHARVAVTLSLPHHGGALSVRIWRTDARQPQQVAPEPIHGAHIGEPFRPSASQAVALREAIATLSPMARSELYALVRIGQGDLAAKQWHRGLSETSLLGDETIAAALVEDPDLHDHIMKDLYEAELAS
jgi:hypothetical protein